MSPRRSVAEARRTRAAIIARALAVASLEGLEGLTIGRLAAEVRLSKSGVLGHFGSKQALQLATLEAAIDLFRAEVWERAAPEAPGLPRLLAVCDAWIVYLDTLPGGCFLTAASCEFDGREGAVRDAVSSALSRWRGVLEAEVRTAVEAGDLAPDLDPAAVAFQLNALAIGANQGLQLFGDRRALRLARQAMEGALGLGAGSAVA